MVITWIFPSILIAALLSGSTYAGTLPIPVEGVGEPAVDLLYQGEPLNQDAAIDLLKQGVDLSLLDPASSDIWQPISHSRSDFPRWNYPPEGAELIFDSKMASASEMNRSRVLTDEGIEARSFQLTLSLYSHAALAKAALLRRLGYPVATPAHYNSLTLRFASLEQRENYVDNLVLATGKQKATWITAMPEDEPVLQLQDVLLEPAQVDMPQYHWGTIIVDPERRVDHIQGRRAIRALLVPLVLLDIPEESINLFPWETGRIHRKHVLLTHPYAENFSEVTYDDLRWIGRRIALLTREDFHWIIQEGRFPADVSALLLEKLVARRNHLMALLDLHAPKLRFNARLNQGAVKKGRLTQAKYPGYAQTFALDDPKSPLRFGELSRYFAIEGISQGLALAAGKLNQGLVLQGMEDLVDARQARLLEDLKRHVKETPDTPFVQPIRTWGGLLGSAGVNASRHVMTGTYFGSESKVQLVDSFGYVASAGYFMGLEGLRTILPSLSANVSLQRNYIHIRGITDMKSALKSDWRDLYVPGFLKKISNLIHMSARNPRTGEAVDPLNDLLE